MSSACTARASQLEGRVSTLESALAKQEEILVAAQEEMQEKILAADERSVVSFELKILTNFLIFLFPDMLGCAVSTFTLREIFSNSRSAG